MELILAPGWRHHCIFCGKTFYLACPGLLECNIMYRNAEFGWPHGHVEAEVELVLHGTHDVVHRCIHKEDPIRPPTALLLTVENYL